MAVDYIKCKQQDENVYTLCGVIVFMLNPREGKTDQ